MFKIILKVVGTTILILIFVILGVGLYLDTPSYKSNTKTDHFDGSHFYHKPEVNHTLTSVIKWMFTSNKKYWPAWIDIRQHHIQKYEGQNARVTFINHATVLIDTEKLSILVDPIWSDTPSPIPFLGPKRVHQPGLALDTLPHVDVILITHNHYDHLDIPTLKKLKQYYNPEIITGLGNKALLEKLGFKRVTELDWWEHTVIKGQKITFVPAVHYSRRSLFDANRSLWGGFVVGVPSGNIYVSGDTANGPLFQTIGEKFQPILLAVLPIGSYEPQWFMESVHINPAQAVQAHIALNANTSLGVHWGTFQLSDEMRFQPIWDLRRAMENEDIPESSFLVLNPGESITVPYTPPVEAPEQKQLLAGQQIPSENKDAVQKH